MENLEDHECGQDIKVTLLDKLMGLWGMGPGLRVWGGSVGVGGEGVGSNVA